MKEYKITFVEGTNWYNGWPAADQFNYESSQGWLMEYFEAPKDTCSSGRVLWSRDKEKVFIKEKCTF